MRPARAILVGLTILLATASSRAQDGLEEKLLHGRPWMVMASSQVTFAIEAARKALKNENWERAALEIQPLFEDYANHVVTQENETFQGARRWAIEWIETWPEAARSAQVAFADAKAAPRYVAGLEARDRDRLTEVWRRHPRSSYAARALNARALLDLASGRLDSAADGLRRLLERSDLDGVVSRTEALVRYVWILARLGRTADVEAVLTDLDGVDIRVRVGEREGPASDVARKFVADAVRAGPVDRLGRSHYGGRPDHADLDDEAPSLEGRLQWERGAPHLDVRARRLDGRDRGTHLRLESWLPMHPILHEGYLIAHDGNNVIAVDAFTGETAWSFVGPAVGNVGRTNFGTVYSATALDGVVYVNLEVNRPPASAADTSFQNVPIVYPIPQRRLFAFEVRTGRLLWSHEDESLDRGHPDASFLRRMTVDTPPLVVGDRLYVPMTYFAGRYEIILAAFDAKTGHLEWQTHVANGQMELNLFGRPVKEAAPSTVAFDGNSLYFSTNVGVVAAIDAHSGYLQWIRGYPTIPIPFSRRWWKVEERPPTWTNNPPIVKDGIVYFTPTDSRHLVALNTADASTRWRFDGGDPPRFPGDARRLDLFRELLGIDEKFVYVAGPNLFAIDRRSGKATYRGEFSTAERSYGRGVVTPTQVLVPTSDALYRYSTKNLELKSRTEWPTDEFGGTMSGNLFAQRGLLIAAGRSELRAFIDWPSIFSDLEARIRRAPSDIELRLKLGRVTLHRGWFERAEAVFRKARALAGSAPAATRPRLIERADAGLFDVEMTRARRALEDGELDDARRFLERSVDRAPTVQGRVDANVELYRLEGLTSGPAAARRVLRELEKRDGDAIAEFTVGSAASELRVGARALRLAVEQGERLGDHAGAVDDLQGLIERYPAEPIDGEDASIWARRKITSIIDEHGRGAYRKHDAAANRALRAAIEADLESGFEAVANQYPNSGAAPAALLRIARRRFEVGDDVRCGALLRRYLREYPGHDGAAGALVTLFDVSRRRDHIGAAVAALKRLRDRYAGRTVVVDGARIEASAFATARLAEEPYASANERSDRPWLQLPLERAWKIERGRNTLSRLLTVSGAPAQRAEDLAFVISNGVLEALAAQTGKRVWRIDLPNVRLRGAFCEGLLTVISDETVLGIDPADGTIVWRVDTERTINDLVAGEDTVYALLHDARGRREQEVVALSGATGAVVWKRTFEGAHWPLELRDDVLVLTRRSPSVALILDPIAGLILHRLEFRRGLTRAPVLASSNQLLAFHGSDAVELWSTRTGELEWRWALPKSKYVRSAHVMEDALLVTDTEDSLHVIELGDGSVRWTKETDDDERPVTFRSETSDEERVFVVYENKAEKLHEIVAMSAKDGKEIWTAPLVSASTLQVRPVATADAILYHALAYDMATMAWSATTLLVNPTSGEHLQKIAVEELSREISEFVLDRGRIGFFAQGTIVFFGSSEK